MAFGNFDIAITGDSTKFRSELTKATSAAQTASKGITSAFANIKALAALGGGLGVVAWAQGTISAAAALDDLADSTGSSVEALSKLQNQARISGADFGTLQGLVLKLATGMAGVEEEGSKVARALAALKVTARDPAEALQQVALSLDKYADGIGKAALARDLFGKGGPAFLAVLKDIAANQDVLATVTAKQAEEAEKFEQSMRRLTSQAILFKTALLQDVVPALNQWVSGFQAARAAGLGFFDSLNVGTTYTNRLGPSIDATKKKIAELTEQLEYSKKRGFGADYVEAQLEPLQKRLAALQAMTRNQALSLISPANNDSRDIRAQAKPKLDYTGAGDDKAAKAKVDEFAKALELVSKAAAVANGELGAAFSGEQMLPAQKALASLMADDAWGKFTTNQKETIKFAYEGVIATEKSTQALKDERAEREKMIKSFEGIAAAQERAKEIFTGDLGHYAEDNANFERSIALIGADDAARQKLAATIEYETLKKQALAAEDELALAALDAQYQKRLKLIDVQSETVDRIRDQAEVQQLFEDSLGVALSGLTDKTKSYKDVFKDLENTIVAGLNRMAKRTISDALFGKNGSGSGGLIGDWLNGKGGIGGIIGSLFGGNTSMSGAAFNAAGGNALDPLGFFGIPGLAAGTDYARGGITLVGERGPELVNMPRGARVTPNHELRAAQSQRLQGDRTYNISVNVLPGASRASADQAALAMGRELRISAMRNG